MNSAKTDPSYMLNNTALPILYSLKNCPYAMRARMAVFYSQDAVILRNIVLSNKPTNMLDSSPKGTVPVLVLPEQEPNIIDESLDIMLWALSNNDPSDLLDKDDSNSLPNMLKLIASFDNEFKSHLEAYKCAKRYHEDNLIDCRQACETFIRDLEQRLTEHHITGHSYLMSTKLSLADIAIFPFIRQFAKVERQWYLQAPYPQVRNWLNHFLQSAMFTKVMTKYPLWSQNSEQVIFPKPVQKSSS